MADLELKTMSIDEDYKRSIALRLRVMSAIRKELERDNCCKNYEGTFEIIVSYPNYFDLEYDNKPDEPDFYIISLHCYVLGPGRHYEWKGRTLKNALDKAENDINKWIREDDNALIAEYDRVHIGEAGKARKLMEDAPTVDAVEVIRCKDCKYHQDTSVPEYKHCCLIGQTVKYNAFCSYGE